MRLYPPPPPLLKVLVLALKLCLLRLLQIWFRAKPLNKELCLAHKQLIRVS
jgi:hypothetical protein